MSTRRDFIKKAALLAGAASFSKGMPASLARAMAIDPKLGSSFYDAEHVVLLMQENRSFDHAFGTLQGVRGFNDPRAMLQPNQNKVWLQTDQYGKTYAPFRLDIRDSKVTWMGCLPHNWTDQTDAYNNGKMDRWLDVKRSGFKEFANMPLTMGHYTREDIPFYYSLADAFTICDQHFCSSRTGTNPNRLYFWTGNIREGLDGKALVWNGDSEFTGKANWRTFPERLSEQGVAWKIYQNEISSSSAGYMGEANSWLGNFGCNALECFPQYEVKYSARYKEVLQQEHQRISQAITGLTPSESEQRERLQAALTRVESELNRYGDADIEQLPPHIQDLHRRAFVNNAGDPDYMQLETMDYQDGDTERSLRIPKGDILHQFRKDVESGSLPTVSWLVPPQLFSDHPDSPWFGSWYVSEVMDILTKNPEVWKKTVFILTYDENDGYFDHAAPFAPPSPYDNGSGKVSPGIDTRLEYVRREDQYHADQGRVGSIGLGYRVPLIIASPWTRGGWVNSQVFDHTSSLQFLEKFISHKTGQTVTESNISAWRRAVCGDLTSAFRPYHGEPLTPLTSLDKQPFIKSIHQAKFKDVPHGYHELNSEDIQVINADATVQHERMPRQEPGVRQSNALPYELYADGRLNEAGQYCIDLRAGNEVFGRRAAGSAFNIYAQRAYLGEDGRKWDYAVAPGNTVSDTWQLEQFEGERYRLAVYGPNGFYRSFSGDKTHPEVHIRCTYAVPRDSTIAAGLVFTCHNHSTGERVLVLADNSYGQATKTIRLQAGQSGEVNVALSQNHGWYDVSIRCENFETFEECFAGRVETGSASITDPLMGGVEPN